MAERDDDREMTKGRETAMGGSRRSCVSSPRYAKKEWGNVVLSEGEDKM